MNTTAKKSKKSGGVKPSRSAARIIGAAKQKREAEARTERLRKQAIKELGVTPSEGDASAANATTRTDEISTAKATKGGATAKHATPANVPAKGAKIPKASAKAAKRDNAVKAKVAKPKRVSLLDAAATVLASAKAPMKCVDMVTAVEAQGLWKRSAGKTPEATLYAAVIREIAAKGRESRFKKTERGTFASAGKGA